MEHEPTDRELLREFTELRREAAFQRLAERHVDLVFGTAVRRLGDRAAAQDVTQQVFIRLAQKAAWLRGENSLAGWLYQTTLLETQQWWRGELRRQRREQAAVELSTTMKEADRLDGPIAGVLDEGLMRLGSVERQALILRYFEDRSYREIAALLGIGEDSVRKRSDKALAKLTEFFRQRGYVLPAGAAAAVVFRQAAQAAPSGLAALATRAALSSLGGASLGVTGVLLAKFMGLTHVQTAAVCLLGLAGPLAYEWHAVSGARAERSAAQAALARTQSAGEDLERRLGGVRRRLDALATLPADGTAPATRQTARPGVDANPYVWSEESAYVRVPKAMLSQIQFDTASLLRMPRGPSIAAVPPSDDLAVERLFPLALQETFGATAEEVEGVYAAFQTAWREYRTMAERHSSTTNVPPAEFRLDDMESLTIHTVPFPDEGEVAKQALRRSLSATLGEERTGVLWERNQDSFAWLFGSFGACDLFESFAVGPGGSVGWSVGTHPPGDRGQFSRSGGRGAFPPERVPARFRAFVQQRLAAQGKAP